ncbi:MAG: bile acid:sodium symporter family protein [Candidatus Hydrogenedentota bacterium]|nr:MAG: bile acid:sodium symporter family protein [Candidatus Hydrogenedentota bacterium]
MNWFTEAFPLWTVLGAILAFFYPGAFTWFSGIWITLGLGIIMLSMGITLTLDDFKRVIQMPKHVLLGVVLQFTIMPFSGYFIAKFFHLPPYFAAGLILVACCPGGTASNVISFLAKADVALSVSMTSVSTFLAILLTPILTTWLVGSTVHVNGWGLFYSTVQVVFIPVTAGILLRLYAPKLSARILPIAPPMAVIFIVLIVSSILGAGKENILKAGSSLIASIVLLHTLGFLLGYALSKILMLGKDKVEAERTARTVAIEVGMQNSGLGVVLARQNFSNPLTPIPSALSALTHCILGSLFAAFSNRRPIK